MVTVCSLMYRKHTHTTKYKKQTPINHLNWYGMHNNITPIQNQYRETITMCL